jgi:hypothetical protein
MTAKPLWKVTFTTQNLLLVGVGSPLGLDLGRYVKIRIYRWHWRAKLAVLLGSVSPIGTPFVCWAEMEPYWPNSNVIPLRRSA